MSNPGKVEGMGDAAQQAKAAIELGKNIRATVRDITLEALRCGRLNAEETRQVVRSVMQGASQGLGKAGETSQQALNESMAGVDDALAKSAEALKLAIEEASGRLRDYGKQDLHRAFKELQTLEALFLDTMKDVAEHSGGESREILKNLLRHARDSGTAVGATAAAAIDTLEQKLGLSLNKLAAAGSEVALTTGANIAEAAAGLLAGMADALDAKARGMRGDKG